MRNYKFLAVIACSLSTASVADTLGFEIGAYGWEQNLSGTVASGTVSSDIDVETDLGFSDETANVFYAAFEHPIPIIPNIRLQQTDMDLSATSNTLGFTFGDYEYTGAVKTSIDLSHTDVTLYYEILDNWISLDVGITGRVISDGLIEVTEVSTGVTERFEADGVLPLLYAAARIDLPLTGLYVGVDINGLGVNENSLIDYRANIGYETSIGLGIEAGFRSFELEYDDDDDFADLTVDGAYISAFYHF